MVTFLEMPREIRDKVLSLVLSHHEDAPTDVSDASGRAEFDDIRFFRGIKSRVMYVHFYERVFLCRGSRDFSLLCRHVSRLTRANILVLAGLLGRI
jgi:hypothetical protein